MNIYNPSNNIKTLNMVIEELFLSEDSLIIMDCKYIVLEQSIDMIPSLIYEGGKPPLEQDSLFTALTGKLIKEDNSYRMCRMPAMELHLKFDKNIKIGVPYKINHDEYRRYINDKNPFSIDVDEEATGTYNFKPYNLDSESNQQPKYKFVIED